MLKHFIQTTEEAGHYHVVYQNDEVKQAVSSVSEKDGHSHDVVWVEPQPQMDPITGQPQVDPVSGQPILSGGRWQVGPSSVDGHVHELTEFVEEEPKASSEQEDDIVRDVHRLFSIATEVEADSFKKAEESDKFYVGEQWDNTLRQKLDSMNRASVTLNFIEKNVDDLSGYQIEQRTEPRYLPVEGGDQRVADLFTFLAKHALEKCNYQREKSKVFIDQLVPGRGLFNIYVDYSKNLQGDIVVEAFPWRAAVFGPHEKEDASDADYFVKHKMYSVSQLKSMYPEKADEFDRLYDSFLTRETSEHVNTQIAYSSPESTPIFSGEFSNIDISRKSLRLLECVRKIHSRTDVVVFQSDELYVRADRWSKETLKKARTIPGVVVFEAPVTRIRITKVVGSCLVRDDNPADLPADEFFLVPVYGKFRNGRYWGKVERAKDAQREINKRHSQAIDIGNKCAAYGFFHDQDTFPNEEALQQWLRQASSPGFQQEVTDADKPPRQLEGVKFPTEIVNLMVMNKEDLRELMNIEVVPQGANDSGDKLLTMEKQKMRGNNWVFDNLAFGEKQVGRLVFRLIQKIYTPARVSRLVNSLAGRQAQTPVGEKPLSEYSPEEIYEMLSEVDAEQYDVIVSDGTYTPTVQLANFLIVSDMAQKGMPIPPQILMELMPLPEEQKQKMIEGVMQQQDAQAQEAELTANAEIDKTALAAGIITPRVSEQTGIPAGPITPESMAQMQQGAGAAPQMSPLTQ